MWLFELACLAMVFLTQVVSYAALRILMLAMILVEWLCVAALVMLIICTNLVIVVKVWLKSVILRWSQLFAILHTIIFRLAKDAQLSVIQRSFVVHLSNRSARCLVLWIRFITKEWGVCNVIDLVTDALSQLILQLVFPAQLIILLLKICVKLVTLTA